MEGFYGESRLSQVKWDRCSCCVLSLACYCLFLDCTSNECSHIWCTPRFLSNLSSFVPMPINQAVNGFVDLPALPGAPCGELEWPLCSRSISPSAIEFRAIAAARKPSRSSHYSRLKVKPPQRYSGNPGRSYLAWPCRYLCWKTVLQFYSIASIQFSSSPVMLASAQ